MDKNYKIKLVIGSIWLVLLIVCTIITKLI